MQTARRRELASRLLAGYVSGPAAAHVGSPQSRAERLGFHICVGDLEEELIRAAGPEAG